jgi:hypothetical protein
VKSLLLASLFLLGAEPSKIGSDTYGETTVKSLELLGTYKFKGTTVSELLKITGNLVAQKATLHEIDAEGDVKLTDSSVTGPTQVVGSLQAKNSDFQGTLAFTGQKALFTDCKLKGITMRRDAAFKANQVLELKGNTVISGPVVFEGGGGVVSLYPGSKIMGPVTGGVIKQKK